MTNLEKYVSSTDAANTRIDLYLPKEVLNELAKMNVAERIKWLVSEVEE